MTRNLVGFHVLDGPRTGAFLDMVGRLYDNGTPVPIVNVVNNWDIVHEIHRRSPATKLFARLENGSNPKVGDNGADYLNARLPALAPVLNIATVQVANEHNGDKPNFLSDFYCQMATRAKAIGARITMGDLAVGNPGGDMIVAMQALAPMFQMAQDLGFPVNYHMYGDQFNQADMNVNSQYFMLRWVLWLKSFPRLKIAGLEGGPFDSRFVSVDRTMSLVKQENVLLQPFADNVEGLCQWTEGGTVEDGWEGSSIDSVFNPYETWAKGFTKMGGTSTGPTTTIPAGRTALIDATRALPDMTPVVYIPQVSDQPVEYMLSLGDARMGLNNIPADTPETWTVAVTATVLNVRSAPDPSKNNIIAKYSKGTVLTVIAADDATRAKDNGYVQIAGQANHWIAYQWLAAKALKPTA